MPFPLKQPILTNHLRYDCKTYVHAWNSEIKPNKMMYLQLLTIFKGQILSVSLQVIYLDVRNCTVK